MGFIRRSKSKYYCTIIFTIKMLIINIILLSHISNIKLDNIKCIMVHI